MVGPTFLVLLVWQVINQSDAQTQDGHAMMKSDTFHSFQNMSHVVRGCHNSVLSLRVE